MQAYVDDVVVKMGEDERLIYNLAETFNNLWKFKMKLNPDKRTFEQITRVYGPRRGIDPNLELVLAITRMTPPESLHDVWKLMMCMAALSRFISRLDVKGLPFFKLLKKRDKF
jgi:hypothetical protein